MIKLMTLLREGNNFEQITTVLNYDECKKILFDECSKNYKISISTNRWLWKGIDADFAFSYVDGNKLIRSSIGDYGNFYNEIIDNSPKWEAFPKRRNSIICTNNYRDTTEFGSYRYVVIPFDDVDKFCCLPKSDMWDSFNLATKYFKVNNLEIFNHSFENFIRTILPIHFRKQINEYNIDDIIAVIDYVEKNYESVMSAIDGMRNERLKEIFQTFADLNYAKLNYLFSPKYNNINLCSYNDAMGLSGTREIYFSGECLIINEMSKLDFMDEYRET